MFSVPRMSLGSNIRRHRAALNLTLDQLSELTGNEADVGTISALEIRGSKRSQYAACIARAMSITVEQLLDDGFSILDARPEPAGISYALPTTHREAPTDPATLLQALATHISQADPERRQLLISGFTSWVSEGAPLDSIPTLVGRLAPAQETPRKAA